MTRNYYLVLQMLTKEITRHVWGGVKRRSHSNEGPNQWHYKMNNNLKNSSQKTALPRCFLPTATMELNFSFPFFIDSANQIVSLVASIIY